MSATDGSFAGNVHYGGNNLGIGGTLVGRLYGPAAQELGASFSASNRDGATLTGTLTGQRTTELSPINMSLTNLRTEQRFFTQNTLLSVTTVDGQSVQQVSDYPSALGAAVFVGSLTDQTSGNIVFSPGLSNLPGGNLTTTSIVTGTDPNFVRYEKDFDGQAIRLELYRPGNSNRELALTYASFGRWSGTVRSGSTSRLERLFFAYGFDTPAGLISARTGSARYDGVAYGAGANANTRTSYDVTGTSRFDVDFSSQQFSGALALRGTQATGTVDFGNYSFSGRMNSGSNAVNSSLQQGGAPVGAITARFFGPDAEEIAGPFRLVVPEGVAGAGTLVNGVVAAKRQ
jgi:hypothetical protein